MLGLKALDRQIASLAQRLANVSFCVQLLLTAVHQACSAISTADICLTQRSRTPRFERLLYTLLAGCGAHMAVDHEQTAFGANALEGKRMTAELLG